MGLLGSLFGRKKVGLTTDTVEKTREFIAPQISIIEDTYGASKYSVITFESIAYAVAIAETFGRQKLISEEIMPFLLKVFGSDYEMRFSFLFQNLAENYGPSALAPNISSRMKDLARNDVINGINKCSNYLVSNANEINSDIQRWKKITI